MCGVIVNNKDDLEVRYWSGTIPHNLDGVVLRWIDNQWSGVHIHGSSAERQDFLLTQKDLTVPNPAGMGLGRSL